MGEKTGISWTDATWNCWQGCHKVSPGCKNCYMFTDKKRYGQDPDVVVRSSPATFNAPLKWAKNPEKYGHIKRVFVDSWSDFFIEEADPWRAEAWAIMRSTPQFVYQLCTKRPERILQSLPPDWGDGYPNVWLGVTVDTRRFGYPRVDCLRDVRAAVRFLSCEPLLEDIGDIDLTGIGWVICGGESGANHRDMQTMWADGLRARANSFGARFFMKQMSAHHPTDDLIPPHLLIRQFPEVK